MNKNDLSRLIDQYDKSSVIYKNPKEYNEQNCRDEFISPLLECFGWDVHNKRGTVPQYREVVVEKFSSNAERPDYTLTLNGVSKIFVEAKKPSIDITTHVDSALQTRSYGWNAKHKIAILTNFENLLIFDTTNKPKKGDTASTSLYRKYYYRDYLDKYDEICSLLSRNTVYTGKFDEFLKGNFQNIERYTTEIDDVFLEQINHWRLDIGNYLLKTNEVYKNTDFLNDVVQEFINQIIFLRICEDRNLPLYYKLKETAENKLELKNTLMSTFKKADKRYNSKLFAGENIIFDLDNEIIYHMIMSLYYPETPYLFNIIEPGILGKIYESFLSESLVFENGVIALASKKEYKQRSVVSTPIEIVKFKVKISLSSCCKEKSAKEILKLRIADIACGSGVFLEEAFQYLIDYCVEWYMKYQPSHLIELSNGKRKLPLEDKKKILTNCIYGVDIDVHAVEVCKFSLLIKLIEDETPASVHGSNPILPDLDRNIKAGNSLITRDDLGDVSSKVLVSVCPFDWCDLNEGNPFDAIIGNPPYVKTEDLHNLETKEEFSVYKNKFKSAYKQFDKYFLFVEQALNKLNSEGQLCYIIPNKFFNVGAGKELRKLLSEKVMQLYDFKDMQLFPDKTIYSSIILCNEKQNTEMEYVEVNSLAKLWVGEKQKTLVVKNKDLDETPWTFVLNNDVADIFSKIKEYCTSLDKVVDIFNGIQTSAEKSRVYEFINDEVLSETDDLVRIKKFEKEYCIEKKILKPYFKPTKKSEKGKMTYTLLDTDKRIIFPYTQDGKLININVMKKSYPHTYKYLLDNYELLVPKCLNNGKGRDIKGATKETWYQYGRSQALSSFFNTPKLIVRVMNNDVPMYAYDEKDMLISSGGTAGHIAISSLPDSEYDLAYVQAWLNNPYMQELLQNMGSDFEGNFTSGGTSVMRRIPFLKLDFNDQKQKDAYDEIVKWTRKVYNLNMQLDSNLDKATNVALEREKEKLIKQINERMSKIYRLQF